MPLRAEALLQAAQAHFAAGNPVAAQNLLETLRQQDPSQAEAWHLLGLIAYERGQFQSALELIHKAQELAPDDPLIKNSLGLALLQNNQPESAIKAFRQAVQLHPQDPVLRVNLANLLTQQGDISEALSEFDLALALDPSDPQICRDYARTLQAAGQFIQAESLWRKAWQSEPDAETRLELAGCLFQQQRYVQARQLLVADITSPAALHLLGLILQAEGQPETALPYLRQAVSLEPAEVSYRVNLAACLLAVGNLSQMQPDPALLQEALMLLQRAVHEAPGMAQAHYNLGCVLAELNCHAEAVLAYQSAIALQANAADAWANLGRSWLELAQLQSAQSACRQALQLKPEDANLHCLYASALLAAGNFEAGFTEYEWRLRGKIRLDPHVRKPCWAGEDLNGQTLLILSEQGFGDMIQFVRYIYSISAKYIDVKLILQFPEPLLRLFQTMPGVAEVRTHQPRALADYDYFVPLLSLPRLCLPQAGRSDMVPYFYPVAEAGPRLPERQDTKLRVGLVWATGSVGNTSFKRSIPVRMLAPLMDLPDIHWYSLQVGSGQTDLQELKQFCVIEDLAPLISDFMDTACLLQQLDLLISVDTACCHLAGALALPVWTLLSFSPDWRWMLDRPDSDWYPTMRLFRQPGPGDWPAVVHLLRAALASAVRSRLEFSDNLARKACFKAGGFSP